MWNSDSSGSELEFVDAKSGKKNNKNKNKNFQNQLKQQSPNNRYNSKRTKPKSSPGNVSVDDVTPATNSGDVEATELPEPEVKIVLDKPEASGKKEEMEEEGSFSSSDDEDDSDEGAMGYGRQALGIDPSETRNYDGKSIPQNGSQYLLSVMQERGKAPKVVVADVDKISAKLRKDLGVNYLDRFKKEVTCCTMNEAQKTSLMPGREWRDRKLQDFSLLRSKVERWRELLAKGVTKLKTDHVKLPEAGNRVVWQRFCFGLKFEEVLASRNRKKDTSSPNSTSTSGPKDIPTSTIVLDYFKDLRGNYKVGSLIKQETDYTSSPLSPSSITTTSDASQLSQEPLSTDGCQPLMSVMLILPQKQIEQLIYYQADWISRYGFLNKCQGEWLYALLSCVDKPLDPSTMADIRSICKLLIYVRNGFCDKLRDTFNEETSCDEDKLELENVDKLSDDFKKELNIEDEEELKFKTDEYLNALHLFIYLIGDYFNQKDLIMTEFKD